MTTMVLKSL